MEFLLFSSVIVLMPYLFISGLLTKELYLWEPSLIKKIILIIMVWLLPFIGVIIAYKSLDLSWFKNRKKLTTNAQSGLSGALLEADAIFNPGQRHVIEQKQKEHIELTEDVGEQRKNGFIDSIKLK